MAPTPGTFQKPRFNVYTMMLFISLVALIIACVLLYQELLLYGDFPWWKTTGATP